MLLLLVVVVAGNSGLLKIVMMLSELRGSVFFSSGDGIFLELNIKC
jgi:hypothetical protein